LRLIEQFSLHQQEEYAAHIEKRGINFVSSTFVKIGGKNEITGGELEAATFRYGVKKSDSNDDE